MCRAILLHKLARREDEPIKLAATLAACGRSSLATYAIGDVQGCFRELRALLELSGFDRARDRLWFVGDLVNRGPESLATLRFVRDLGDGAVVVLGNHDLHLLALAEGRVKRRKDDSLEEVLAAPDRRELLDWLRARPMIHADANTVLVHAGLLPQWDIAAALRLAHEVEAELRGPGFSKFLETLYGSRPDRWDDGLQGPDRSRVIVNAMTRLRFCTREGVMEFETKGETAQAPKGYLPWFDVPGRKSAGSTIVCGHWSALGLRLAPELIALDSGCVWGGQLSAIRLEDRRVYQVPCAANASSPERAPRAPRR
ncbi:MAG TPA: symmetrical bis(5'-nucleosyl)-tetraphosphatase [Burkholderiales bacterium]|nr:symmetrical bis(5'-nucleosyl)-tetraphosphatase [Burkholderiales bacterium]